MFITFLGEFIYVFGVFIHVSNVFTFNAAFIYVYGVPNLHLCPSLFTFLLCFFSQQVSMFVATLKGLIYTWHLHQSMSSSFEWVLDCLD